MERNRFIHVKNIILPCLLLSTIAGMFTGALIFLFKIAASAVISYSVKIYAFFRTDPAWLPLFLVGAALLGLFAWLTLCNAPHCRGGGIPTAVAILRGLIPFHWIKSIFFLFASAMLTFLGGVPLGNEGPSVQMGTAVGRGTVRIFANKHQAWDRYIMTGGACAGFSAATGAPVTGIFFAFEEAHRRFSPMIFMSAATAVIASTATMELLCGISGTSSAMFHLSIDVTLPLRYIYTALIIGVICGTFAMLFTKVYRFFRNLIQKRLSRIPFLCKIIVIFTATALIGFVFAQCTGSGHALIDELLEGRGVWYLLILYLCIRALLLIFANNVGVTGGLFIPQLTFGAILGALCARTMTAIGILPSQYYVIMVVIGMASFLGASLRTPITAVMFAVEALCGLSNLLPIMIGVTFSFLVIETLGVPAFNDTVIEGKVEEENAGKKPRIVDTYLTVQPNSFVVGKEIRDILWPPTCVILSVEKASTERSHMPPGIGARDVLHVHYLTYEPRKTTKELEALVGKQKRDTRMSMHPGSDSHQVPEL